MLYKRTSSKSLTRKKESKTYSRKEKKRRIKEEKAMELPRTLVKPKKLKKSALLISLRVRSLKIISAPQMMMLKKR